MADWGPIFVSFALFIMLSPGVLFQLPGRNRFIEFGNFHTSGASVTIHSIIYFALVCIFFLAVKVHLHVGS